MFRLRTLGGVSLVGDDASPTGRTTQRRRLALLALLAVARDRGMSRDKILACLWPESDGERARHALSQSLYGIRHELGEAALVLGIDDVRLNAGIVASDVDEFERSVAAGKLEAAVELYGGPFLDGFFLTDNPEFERWSEIERQRLASLCGGALEALAADAERQNDHRRASGWWRRRANLDPYDSGIAVRLMTALAAAGDRAGALQHARVHALLLQEQLDAPPDASVAALAEQLRGDSPASPTPAALVPLPPPHPLLDAPLPATPLPGEAPRPARRPLVSHRWAAGLAACIGAALIGSIVSPESEADAVRAPRTVVLGAIWSPDSTLGLTIREALRAELEADPGIRVLAPARVQETLRLMEVSGGTELTAGIAAEVAQRSGVPLAVVGSIAPLGTGAQVVARLVDARTGATLVSLSERPARADDVIPAVTRLALALRERVTGLAIDSAAAPLPAVTTASLPALRNYALARAALARQDREAAIALLEGALVHDSLFTLAHYLVGDLLWYVDRQQHSDQHLTRARELSARLPPREQLIVRARYEQVVGDRPDSALVYWELLRASYPDEPLAYEGIAWAYRAVGRGGEAGAAAEAALDLDPTSIPMMVVRMQSLLTVGDTVTALAFARTIHSSIPSAEAGVRAAAAFHRRDWPAVLSILDSAHQASGGVPGAEPAYPRHIPLLAMGRLVEGAQQLEAVRRNPWMQNVPRALLLQAKAEAGLSGSRADAAALAREALEWIEQADLSPPAYGRLIERTVDVAARVGDLPTIAAARRLIETKDARRGLPSYRLTLRTIDAADAFARGNMTAAAAHAASARTGSFFGRSMHTVILLEADARASLGERVVADSLYRLITSGTYAGDSDGETWAVLQAVATRAISRQDLVRR